MKVGLILGEYFHGPTRSSTHVLTVVFSTFLLFVVGIRKTSPDPYLYDEADYMYAASLGFFANYTEQPSLSLSEFLRTGLGSFRQEHQRSALSEHLRGANDVSFYRHGHGPLYYYLLIPLARAGLNERSVRIAMFSIPAVTLVLTYLGCLWVMPGSLRTIAALLASALFLTSDAVNTSTELAPHQLFVLCSLGSLLLVAKALASGRRVFWYASVAAAALAFCTLEIALVLLITIAICGYFNRNELDADWNLAGRSIGIFVAVVVAVWPAAVFKFSFAKAYLMMIYLAIFRSPWEDAEFFEIWRHRFLASPVEWAVIFVSGVIYFRTTHKQSELYPVLLFAALMIAATLRVVSSTARYALLFMPALDLFAGLTLAPWIGRLRRPASFAVVAILAVSVGTSLYRAVAHPYRSNPRSSAVLSYIHQKHLEDKTLLVPHEYLPTIHYYFPAARLRGYYSARPTAADLTNFPADAILHPTSVQGLAGFP